MRWNRVIEDTVIFAVSVATHAWLIHCLAATAWARARRWVVPLAILVAVVMLAANLGAFTTHFARFEHLLPGDLGRMCAAVVLLWDFTWGGTALVLLAWRAVPPFRPERRRALNWIKTATVAAPVAVSAFGVLVARTDFEISEVDLRVPGLPPDLNGLRLVQLSDIHLSPFLSESELARVVDMANEAKANLALVTGDLISYRGDPLEVCLRQLARLRSDAGTWGCLGNHEVYAKVEKEATEGAARLGMHFLRQQATDLRFGNSTLRLAGVDYQRLGFPYLPGAEKMVRRDPGTLNVLLSHNPDVLPVAERKGYQVMLAGHTHGGQVNVEILGEDLNVARFYTPFVKGLYRHGNALGYVNRGVGTIGMPARLGVRPEVAVLRLCAI